MADTLFIRWVNEENKTSKPLGFPPHVRRKEEIILQSLSERLGCKLPLFTLEHFVGSFNTNRANHVWLLCDSGG